MQTENSKETAMLQTTTQLAVPTSCLRSTTLGVALLLGLILLVQWSGFPTQLFDIWIGSFVLVFAMNPVLRICSPRWRVPVFISAMVIICAVIVGIALLIIPEASRQAKTLLDTAPNQVPMLWRNFRELIAGLNPDLASTMDRWIHDNVSSARLWSFLGGYAGEAPKFLGTFSTNIGYFSLMLVFSLLLISTENYIAWFAGRFLPKHQQTVKAVLERTRDDIGHWAWAQLFVSILLGVSYGLVLSLLGVPFAVAIGLITIFADLIPNCNVIGLVLALIAVATGIPNHSEFHNVFEFASVPVVWGGLVWIEANVIWPRTMNKVLHIHGFFILSFVFCGFIMHGLIGATFAIPALILCRAWADVIWPGNRSQVR